MTIESLPHNRTSIRLQSGNHEIEPPYISKDVMRLSQLVRATSLLPQKLVPTNPPIVENNQRQVTTHKTKHMLAVEARLGEPLEQVLTRLHHEQGMTIQEINTVIEVSDAYLMMRRLGVKVRNRGESLRAAAKLPQNQEKYQAIANSEQRKQKYRKSIKEYYSSKTEEERKKATEPARNAVRTAMFGQIMRYLGSKPYQNYLQMLGRGMTQAQIADSLKISRSTLKKWVAHLRKDYEETPEQINRSIWSSAKYSNPRIIERIVTRGLMTWEEIRLLRDHFDNRTVKLNPNDSIFEKFSIAVANIWRTLE